MHDASTDPYRGLNTRQCEDVIQGFMNEWDKHKASSNSYCWGVGCVSELQLCSPVAPLLLTVLPSLNYSAPAGHQAFGGGVAERAPNRW